MMVSQINNDPHRELLSYEKQKRSTLSERRLDE